MAILLLRHGETALNAARVVQPADTPLSARGQAQADALAARLATGRIAAILSSDLPRAMMTAAPLAAACALPVRTSALLQERNFGALRGRAYDTLGFNPQVLDEAPEGGESAGEFSHRAQQAFELMLAHQDGLDGDLAVVTHGLLIRVLMGDALRLDAETMHELELANTSVSIFDPAPPHALSLLNCTRHLDAAALQARGLSGG